MRTFCSIASPINKFDISDVTPKGFECEPLHDLLQRDLLCGERRMALAFSGSSRRQGKVVLYALDVPTSLYLSRSNSHIRTMKLKMKLSDYRAHLLLIDDNSQGPTARRFQNITSRLTENSP